LQENIFFQQYFSLIFFQFFTVKKLKLKKNLVIKIKNIIFFNKFFQIFLIGRKRRENKN